MVSLALKDFATATRRMVELSGVKKTRLMLRVRPSSARKTFILKSTDGRTTLTTRVADQSELKVVEEIVNDFVTQCTSALTPPPAPLAANPQAPPQKKATENVAPSGGGSGNKQSGGGKKRKGGRH
ncbi:hypothetical protein ERJ75_001331100 [Trypanosoma vivax]|uniref:SRP9 domain-containing protein n=1 Tax=Trypanosoma vivax (strain Y486) TaxID=1055687 RepID=G0TRQ1_TRYVY|nr:hypothetical protein TRVL_04909 [Trypanosoma vivax]KAH8608163.1 hypothetical protein ERJ75_001331100 [Trypanosoma vivax]CCC46623.1 conserved hypothetical protein [Trypanosoma vivax Y486]